MQVALLATNPNPNPNPKPYPNPNPSPTKVSACRLARDEERGVEAHAELADEVGLARSGAEGLGELLGAWFGFGFGLGGFALAPTVSANVLVPGEQSAARSSCTHRHDACGQSTHGHSKWPVRGAVCRAAHNPYPYPYPYP